MKRVIFLILLTVSLFFSASCFSAAKNKIKLTGIYSDLTYNKEGGDVLGTEIIIVFSREGYFAVFQTSEGEPSIPIVTSAKINNYQIAFTLPEPFAERGEFIGQISSQGLIGKFRNSDQEFHLKRKMSYWQ